MKNFRTDIALDAALSFENENLDRDTPYKKEQYKLFDLNVSKIIVDTPQGAQSLGKDLGTYVTVELFNGWERDNDIAMRCAKAISQELSSLIPHDGTVLIVGLGNEEITADSIGPKAVSKIIVTRHLKERMPESFVDFHCVSALSPGVLGTTGIETGEIVKGVFNTLSPSVVIAIDALATSDYTRLCTTFQMSDSGISPGSGVGNPRFALTQDSLGVPVVAIGIPTVVDAGVLCQSILENANINTEFSQFDPPLIVTPKDIDKLSDKAAGVIATALNICLHEKIGIKDLIDFMA